MRRNGFTLIELVVAITLSGIVLLGARALWESLAGSVDRLRAQVADDARDENGERLLRSLVGRLEVGTDQSREFAGDERHTTFTTWCEVPAGWQERCAATLAIEPDSGINRETIFDCPSILNVDAFIVSLGDTASGVVIDIEVAIVAAAVTGGGGTIFRNIG